jgi:hypothetical protein
MTTDPRNVASSKGAAAASPVDFETYYTLQSQSPSNANYLSWEKGKPLKADPAITYPTAKDLWFSAVSGTDSGAIVTGVAVYIKIAKVIHLYLGTQGPAAEYACWTGFGVLSETSYEWALYVDPDLIPSKPIVVGQSPVYIASVGYPGNFLIPGPQYVTIGSSPTPWAIQPEGGA